jgi:hypothetical protein
MKLIEEYSYSLHLTLHGTGLGLGEWGRNGGMDKKGRKNYYLRDTLNFIHSIKLKF